MTDIFEPLRRWRPAYGQRGWFQSGADNELAYGRADGGPRVLVWRADDGLWCVRVGAFLRSAGRPGVALERIKEEIHADGTTYAMLELLNEAWHALPKDLQ